MLFRRPIFSQALGRYVNIPAATSEDEVRQLAIDTSCEEAPPAPMPRLSPKTPRSVRSAEAGMPLEEKVERMCTRFAIRERLKGATIKGIARDLECGEQRAVEYFTTPYAKEYLDEHGLQFLPRGSRIARKGSFPWRSKQERIERVVHGILDGKTMCAVARNLDVSQTTVDRDLSTRYAAGLLREKGFKIRRRPLTIVPLEAPDFISHIPRGEVIS